jgi:hypothetical protein
MTEETTFTKISDTKAQVSVVTTVEFDVAETAEKLRVAQAHYEAFKREMGERDAMLSANITTLSQMLEEAKKVGVEVKAEEVVPAVAVVEAEAVIDPTITTSPTELVEPTEEEIAAAKAVAEAEAAQAAEVAEVAEVKVETVAEENVQG